MKYIAIIGIIILIVLAGCSKQDDWLTSMETGPCHQMPDGSWMGACASQDFVNKSAQASSIVSPGDYFELSAAPAQWKAGDVEINGYAYNNQVPGPVLKVQKDNVMQVLFKNNLPEASTVHWHGLRHDIRDDGIPGISQPPVQPGEEWLYTLYFPDEGLFWYHPHMREDRQQDLGLAGLIRVGNSPYPEQYLVLDDVFIEQGFNFNYGPDHANFALMGRYGTQILVNGKQNHSFTMKAGEIRRVFFANVANARPFKIHIPKSNMKAVGGDIGWYEQEAIINHSILGPSERVAVDVQFDNPGTYEIIHKAAGKKYVLSTITVSKADTEAKNFAPQTNTNIQNEIEQFRKYFDDEPTYTLTLDVDVDFSDMPCHKMGDSWMGDCDPELLETDEEHDEVHDIEWEDNMVMANIMSDSSDVNWKLVDEQGNSNNDINMTAKVGDIIKLRFDNTKDSDHPMQHPIHLHGQRFLVSSVDGEEPELMGWEDTVLVPAGKVVDVIVEVTNPGDWMIHCHIAEHLEAGMMSTIKVTA